MILRALIVRRHALGSDTNFVAPSQKFAWTPIIDGSRELCDSASRIVGAKSVNAFDVHQERHLEFLIAFIWSRFRDASLMKRVCGTNANHQI